MLLHLQILIYGYFQWRQHPLKTRHFYHSSIKCGLPWKYLFGFKLKIISWTTLSTKRREKGQVMTTRRIEAKVKSQVNTLGASSHICSCSIVSESILASSSFTHRYLSKFFFQYLPSFKNNHKAEAQGKLKSLNDYLCLNLLWCHFSEFTPLSW